MKIHYKPNPELVDKALQSLPQPTEEQEAVISWVMSGKSCIVSAVPGAGKSTTNTRLALEIMKSGISSYDMYIGGFLHTTCDVLNDKLMGTYNCLTLHAQRKRRLYLSFTGDFDELLEKRGKHERPLKYLSLDEIEDFNLKRFGVSLSLLGEGGLLVGFTDPFQCIFHFDSAIPNYIEQHLIEKYNCRRFEMLKSWRCHKAIVEALELIYKRGMVSVDGERGFIKHEIPRDFSNLLILTRTQKSATFVSDLLTNMKVPNNLLLDELDDRRLKGNGITTVIKVIHRGRSGQSKRVWLVDWNCEESFGEERNVFYVGVSRAELELYIWGFGALSPFTGELIMNGIIN